MYLLTSEIDNFEEESRQQIMQDIKQIRKLREIELQNNSIKRNVWLCPAYPEDLENTIKNPCVLNLNGKSNKLVFMWGFKEGRKKSWKQMQEGDVCIFGNMPNGWRYISIVKEKIKLENKERKYAFILEFPLNININKNKMRLKLGWTSRGSCIRDCRLDSQKAKTLMKYILKKIRKNYNVLSINNYEKKIVGLLQRMSHKDFC